MEVSLKGAEIECVKHLAKLFEAGVTMCVPKSTEEIGLADENYVAVLGVMEHCGVIANPTHSNMHEYRAFTITAVSVQVARKIEELENKKEEAPDYVAQATAEWKRSPIMGRVIFWGAGVAVVVTIATGVLTSIEKVVTLLRPPQPTYIYLPPPSSPPPTP